MKQQEIAEATETLRGKAAIVTGAAKGLGAAITRDLARQGADVIFVGRDQDALEAHAKAVDGIYGHRRSLTVPTDVIEEKQVIEMVNQALARFGRLDILVNGAGGTGPIETPTQNVNANDFRSILDLNVVGTFLPCKHVIPHMVDRRAGRIVNVSGTSGLRGYPNRVGYSSSKWAVRGLTRTLALELGSFDITVNTVCPNVTHGSRMDTIIQEKSRKLGVSPEAVYEDFAGKTALGRFIDDVDVAAAVSFLVSNGARNITGHDIVVDAGWDV